MSKSECQVKYSDPEKESSWSHTCLVAFGGYLELRADQAASSVPRTLVLGSYFQQD